MATAKNISTENKINIVTNTENNVTVTQPSIQTVEVLTGPQGNKGDAGPAGPTGSFDNVTGSFATTGSNTFIGNQTIIGNISSSGTVFGVTGSFSHLIGNSPIKVGDPVTFEQPITILSGILGIVSSSYAITASYALNSGGGGSTNTGSLLTTASSALNVITFTKGDGSTFPIIVDTGSGGGGGSGYTTIEDEGTPLTQRTTINFVGAGVTATDNGSKTVVTINGGTGSLAAAGNNQEIQYNNNSNLAGSSKFKFIYDSSSLEQGNGTDASGSYSHAEGWFTKAIGQASHAEGRSNTVTGDYSHAEGYNNNVTGLYSHVAGENNILTGRGTYVNGRYNSGSSNWSTVVGRSNILTIDSDYSFVGGYLSKVSSSFYGFAFGESAFVYGNHGFAIGQETSASFYGFALGSKTKASFAARAAGRETTANSRYTHTEGVNTQGGGEFQHLFTSSLTEPTTNWGDPGSDINNGDVWYNTSNSLLYAYTGSGTVSQGFVSQNDEAVTVPFFITSSGTLTTATFGSGDVFPAASSSAVLAARYNYDQAYYSHAEGSNNKTYGRASHAEGYFNQAGGYASHVEGYFTRTGKINEYGAVAQGGSGSYAHAEGWQTQANGIASHAEGFSAKSRGNYSHAQGKVTIAEGDYQHTMGHYNETNTTSLVIIGNGTSSGNRKNLVEFNLNGVLINQPITASNNISSSGTIFANDLILDYDNLPTIDPAVKGQVYRNGSNQLLISAG